MPERAVGEAPPSKVPEPARYRRPADDLVRRAARRVVRGGKASFPSQAAFLGAVVDAVRNEDPLAALGGSRLRRLVVGLPGYACRSGTRSAPDENRLTECPVCGSALTPIRNQTLTGSTIVLGQRCVLCDYWCHAHRRVPIRYSFSGSGAGNRSKRRPS